MKSRKIIVSGASRGIGKAICDSLLQEGHYVVGVARQFESPQEHENFEQLIIDISDSDALAFGMHTIIKKHRDIDGLINNVGVGLFGSLEEFSLKQIEQSLQVNLHSAILFTRLLITTLKKQPRSDVIFIGSESGLQGGRFGTIYSAAKFGLRGFAQSLRHEGINQNLHVGMINPGMVRSNFFDNLTFEPGMSEENALLPEDISQTVLTLINASDHAMIEEININPLKRVIQKKS